MNRKLVSALLMLTLGLSACGPAAPVPPTPIIEPEPPAPADFTLSLASSAPTLQAGKTVSMTANIVRSGDFSGNVTLSLQNPPVGLSIPPVVIPAGVSSVQVMVSASAATLTGQHNLTFAADSGILHKTAGVTLGITAAPAPVEQATLTLSATPSSLTVQAGETVDFTVKVLRNKFSGPVNLHAVNLPAGVSVADVTVADGQDSVTLTLNTTSSSVAQVGNIQLEGVSGGVNTALNIPLTVQSSVPLPTAPTVLSTTPASSAQNVNSASLTVGVTFSQEMKTDVAQFVSITPSVTNLGCAFQDDGAPQSKVLCSGDFKADTSYTVTVGAGARNSAGTPLVQPYSFSFKTAVQVIVNPLPKSLTLSATPNSITVKPGVPATLTVKVVRTNLSGPVTLHLENLPANITAPDVTLPDGQDSATLTVTQTGKSNPFSGPVQLQASAGNVSAALNLPLTVQSTIADTTAPTLVSHTPSSNAVDVPISASVVLNFSEPMNPAQTKGALDPVTLAVLKQVWSNGNTTLTLYLESGGAKLNFFPSATYTVSLSGQDVAGNALVSTPSFSFTTAAAAPKPDTTAPTVMSTLPANAAQNVTPGAGQSFTATFSEKMDASTLSAITLSPNLGATNCTFTDLSQTVVKCVSSAGLAANQFYIMTISTAAKDMAGNPLAQLNSSSFTTASVFNPPIFDFTPPTAGVFAPVNNAIGVARDPLTMKIIFSEAMNKTSVENGFQLSVPNLNWNKVAYSWNAAGTVMTAQYNDLVPYGTNVIWGMDSAASDLAGNKLLNSSNVGGKFRIVRQNTAKLYSNPALDSEIQLDVLTATLHHFVSEDVWVGRIPAKTYKRGFVQFPMTNLPNFGAITKINSAVLNLYTLENQNNPFLLGDLDAVNIATPLSSDAASLWNAPKAASGQTQMHVYQTPGPAIGYHTLDITTPFASNVTNHVALTGLSQWRIHREFDSWLSSQDFILCYTSVALGGNSDVNKRPYILVTYEYP